MGDISEGSIFAPDMIVKYSKYIFTLLFSAHFLMAGMGYNVINYCCDTCANEGIEAVATDSCFAVHHHIHSKQNRRHDDLTCTDLTHLPESCHLYRLSTDIPSYQSTFSLNSSQIQLQDLFIPVFLFLTEKNEFFVQNDISPPDLAVSKTGRALLTFHAVLLI